MIFGGVSSERIVLNEEMMWSGSSESSDREGGHLRLPEIRELIFQGRHAEAQSLVNQTFTCANQGSGRGEGKNIPYGCYQVFGELSLIFPSLPTEVSYRRELDLPTAITSIVVENGSEGVVRTAFASAADDVVVYHLESAKSGALDFEVSLGRKEAATAEARDGYLTVRGTLADGLGGVGARFSGLVKVSHDGEEGRCGEHGLSVRGATVATLFIFMKVQHGADVDEAAMESHLERVAEQGFTILRERHEREFGARFGRVHLHLPSRGVALDTPARVELCGKGEADPALSGLYFHLGRYLLLSSSRETNALPANLQGIWAEEIQTPWNGDFHLNINVQMNYWPAEVANLAECHRPLFALTEALVANGRKTAWAYYGCGGWVAHMMTNPWHFTAPGEDASWGASVTGGAWLCQHLWSHYEFSQDKGYLQAVYPVLREAAEFFRDFLVEDPESGWLVTCPSSSPENWFENTRGEKASVCAGPTMDTAIARELFGHVIEAAEQLGCDESLAAELTALSNRLPPYRIGRHGQLQEWLDDYVECEPDHRHFSHLYGLFPGNDPGFSPASPLREAARTSLLRRGDVSTGWSTAWKACCWARLGDGEKAQAFLQRLTSPPNPSSPGLCGGAYPNLMCVQPPFQIDGNFGGTAAVAEMLVQSHERAPEENGSYVISFLPALPRDWDFGSFSGLRVRGNLEVSARWEQSQLKEIECKSPSERSVFVRYGDVLAKLDLKTGPNIFGWNEQERTFCPALKK